MTNKDAMREELLTWMEDGSAELEEATRVGTAILDDRGWKALSTEEASVAGQGAFDPNAEMALDDLVHDCMDAIGADAANEQEDEDAQEDALDTASRTGSDINNSGLPAQIACILAGNGIQEGDRLIREELGLPAPSRPTA